MVDAVELADAMREVAERLTPRWQAIVAVALFSDGFADVALYDYEKGTGRFVGAQFYGEDLVSGLLAARNRHVAATGACTAVVATVFRTEHLPRVWCGSAGPDAAPLREVFDDHTALARLVQPLGL
ncbi:hypothetical protein AAFP35_17455 [Gordonia sp. CPCC 206044]|uniref:hypothetical protein n=1 Tax=Gordonia sp. CPCC 206044 TaxID=3140793 RepID=UPI003AF3E582